MNSKGTGFIRGNFSFSRLRRGLKPFDSPVVLRSSLGISPRIYDVMGSSAPEGWCGACFFIAVMKIAGMYKLMKQTSVAARGFP